MNRDKAFSLAAALANSGFSVGLSISVHPKMTPSESCVISVSALRFNAEELKQIAFIGDGYDCDLHFISHEGMTLFERPKPRPGPRQSPAPKTKRKTLSP